MAPTTHRGAPPGWAAAACMAWAAGQKVEAVQASFAALNQQATKDPRLVMQAAYYLFLMGDMATLAQLLEHHHRATPDHLEIALNLGVAYNRLGRYAESVAMYQRVLHAHPTHFAACDGLCIGLHRLGRNTEAAAAGTRALQLKHLASQRVPTGWLPPTASPQALASPADATSSASHSGATSHATCAAHCATCCWRPTSTRGGRCSCMWTPACPMTSAC